MPLQPALPTMALGRVAAGYPLVDRLRAMSDGGLRAVEIFYECLLGHAKLCEGTSDEDKLRAAARVRPNDA